MALNKKEINVLCPNGRRVNIKTTSSTSIGQIIEEACIKQNLDPLNYNIKHLKRILDPSNTIQYSNIPNRAQLELVEAEKRRQELNVIVNLVSNEGLRLIHEFSSSSLLWDVLTYHDSIDGNGFSLPSDSSSEEPFLVYTMRKFNGKELKSVTLKSLGLYGGKCMIRYNTQQKEINNQAKGPSSPVVIVSKTTKTSSKSSHNGESTLNDEASSSALQVGDCDTKDVKNIIRTEESLMEVESEESEIQNPIFSNASQNESSNPDIVSQLENRDENLASESCSLTERESDEMEVNIGTQEKINASDPVNIEKNDASLPAVIPLSDHDSILFSLDDAPSMQLTEEEDSFFDLTRDEVRKLHSEQIKIIKEFEEAPLLTNQMRQLEKDSRLLTAMNRYPVTQIRIIFPDRLAIQANFRPRNTVKDVIEFLRPLLVQSDLNFYLYTTHPRKVLDPANSLVDADCIPKALVYFGTEEDLSSYLSEESLSKKSSFDAASKSVIKSKNRQSSYVSGNVSASSIPERILSDSMEQQGGAKVKSSQKPKWFKFGK